MHYCARLGVCQVFFSDKMDVIAKRLKEERERLGFTQAVLGQYGSVSHRAQQRYESGERVPDATYLANIANVGVDIQYVIIGVHSENFPVKTDKEKLLDAIMELSPEEERAQLEEDKRKLIEAIKEQTLEEIRAELEEDKRKLREAMKEHYGEKK